MSDIRITAVLGAGALGAAMAARLGETGHEVRLWNRTAERARAAAAQARGVTAVGAAAEAVSGASVVITVLRDGDAVAEVMADAIAGVGEGAVWIQASTVGPRSARALADLARDARCRLPRRAGVRQHDARPRGEAGVAGRRR